LSQLVCAQQLGVFTGRPGSSLCPTWTRPDKLGWEKLELKTNPCGALDWPNWVLSVLGAYQSVSSSLSGVEI